VRSTYIEILLTGSGKRVGGISKNAGSLVPVWHI